MKLVVIKNKGEKSDVCKKLLKIYKYNIYYNQVIVTLELYMYMNLAHTNSNTYAYKI